MPRGKRTPPAGQPGVVVPNVVNLRAHSDDGSERVTQALIGQPVTMEGGQGDWYFVRTWDAYRGWIPASSLRMLDGAATPYASAGPVAIIRELWVDVFKEPSDRAMIRTKVTVSAELEVAGSLDEWVELRLPDGSSGFIRKHQARLVDRDVAQTMWLPDPAKLVETAARFIGVPYLWGGTSPFGLDCSGFVQLVYRIHNVTLLRDAQMQAGDPRTVPVEKEDLRAGDLVFFARDEKSAGTADLKVITHVGMAIGSGRFIHSGGGVGVGINRLTDSIYPGRYWGARRMRLETLDPGGGPPED